MAKKTLDISEKNWEDNFGEAIDEGKYKAGIAEWLGVKESDIATVPAVEHWADHGKEAIKDAKYEKGIKAYWLKRK